MINLPTLLYIETGTNICSVALSVNGNLIDCIESDDNKAHAAQLSVLIDSILVKHKLHYTNLNAVVVSKGPGSYTGLRIGVATAKGICFGLDIPLIAIDSLLSLTHAYLQQFSAHEGTLYCPMIDARRMEVYSALFDYKAKRVTETQALIIDENSFKHELNNSKIVFFGNGAEKCKEVIKHPNAVFVANLQVTAKGMIDEAANAFVNNQFEDKAYFEPFYLKDFVISSPKKKVL